MRDHCITQRKNKPPAHLIQELVDYLFIYTPIMVNIFKRLCIVYGKHTQEAFPCSHILVPHCTVFFLTCCIKNIQETGFSINYYLLPVGILGGKKTTPWLTTNRQGFEHQWIWRSSNYLPAIRVTEKVWLCWSLLNLLILFFQLQFVPHSKIQECTK